MSARLLLAVAIVTSLTLEAPSAGAYCRTTQCNVGGQGTTCDPPQPTDCEGIMVTWPSPCVGFSVHEGGTKSIRLNDVVEAARGAFAAWENADCGGGETPNIHIEYMGTVECAQVEYNQKAGNANVITFRDDLWPHEDPSILARTTTTIDLEKHVIVNADMEVNSRGFSFATTGDFDQYDLQGVLTHEVGHFLGIGHSTDFAATMFTHSASPDTVGLRTLEADDRAAICAAYPPTGEPRKPCNALPRHGFSEMCAAEQPQIACGFVPNGADRSRAPWSATLLLGVLARGVRRRLRSRESQSGASRRDTVRAT